jgi:hypothetical protein
MSANASIEVVCAGREAIRSATAIIGPNGVVRGRPPIGDADRE